MLPRSQRLMVGDSGYLFDPSFGDVYRFKMSKISAPFQRRETGNQRGGIVVVLGLVGLISFVCAILLHNYDVMLKASSRMRVMSSRGNIRVSSAELLITALKYAEADYMRRLRHCGSANLFLNALKDGHRCSESSVTNIPMMKEVIPAVDGVGPPPIEFPWAWTLKKAEAATGPAQNRFVRVRFQEYQVDFSLKEVEFPLGQARFEGVVLLQGFEVFRFQVGIGLHDVGSHVYFSSATSDLVQQSPLASDLCPNNPWAPWLRWRNGACEEVTALMGATGLTQYNGEFFAFRSFTGDFLYLDSMKDAEYIVNENGLADGKKVFPAYRTLDFVGVNDLEVEGQDSGRDQIYVLASYGPAAELQYYPGPGKAAVTICKLGEMGWAMGLSSLSSVSNNMNLLFQGAGKTVASFWLKSDMGQLILLSVESFPGTPSFTVEAPFKSTHAKRTFVCSALRNPGERQVELTRVHGGTRVQVNKKPYNFF